MQARRIWRNSKSIGPVILFVLIAFENLFGLDLPIKFHSSPFFKVFATPDYQMNRKFDVELNSGSSVSFTLNQVLHRVYDMNPVLGTTVWHVFKFDSLNGREVQRLYMNALFCDGTFSNRFLISGQPEAVAYYNGGGLRLEHRCR